METNEISGVLFDKDGTLTDYHLTWSPLNEAAAAMAAGGDPALIAHLLDLGGRDPHTGRVRGGSLLAAADTREIAEVWSAAGARHDTDSLELGMDQIFEAGAECAVAVTAIGDLFGRLQSRGLALGVATSDSEAGARATLRQLGIDDTSKLFVAGYDSGYGRKPSSGMVDAFCARSGLAPRAVAVVGDNLHDIRMGRAGGCGLCIGVLTGASVREELAGEADYVLESVAALEELLDRFGTGRVDAT
ncbi:MAG: HAD family hydrolase [Halofilum sp. (in: g-proteobacteria)]|nr:HAD family hydrolase [Halofilum sp. (in: g-proteobacteria)]